MRVVCVPEALSTTRVVCDPEALSTTRMVCDLEALVALVLAFTFSLVT